MAGVPVQELDEQLEHFPDWKQASDAIQQGNANDAIQNLQRSVDVLTRMGTLSPMALYARKKYALALKYDARIPGYDFAEYVQIDQCMLCVA